MKIISLLICKLRGHAWGRAQRINAAVGKRTCRRCGIAREVAMKTPFGRKRDATQAQIRG